MPNDVMISFGADVSAVTAGVGKAMAALGAVAPQVDAMGKSFTELGARLKQGLEPLQALSAGAVRDQLKTITDQLGVSKALAAEEIAAAQLAAQARVLSATQEKDAIASIRQQETQAEQDAADKTYQTRLAELEQRKSLLADDLQALQDVQRQEEALTAQHEAQITKLKAEALKQQDNDQRAALAKLQQEWSAIVSPMVSGFNNGLMQMAEGTKSFAQTLQTWGQGLLQDFLKVIDKMVSQWIVGEMTKLAVSRLTAVQQIELSAEAREQTTANVIATNLKQIQSDAATAAGAAYKAMAGIPPAPLWGIAAGALAYAGVMAFEGLASAAGGFDIPAGASPLTQLHAEEMVLPARIANPMRDMLASGGPWSAGASPSLQFGDTHLHGVRGDPAEFRQLLQQHRDALMDNIHDAVRAGWRSTAASPFRS